MSETESSNGNRRRSSLRQALCSWEALTGAVLGALLMVAFHLLLPYRSDCPKIVLVFLVSATAPALLPLMLVFSTGSPGRSVMMSLALAFGAMFWGGLGALVHAWVAKRLPPDASKSQRARLRRRIVLPPALLFVAFCTVCGLWPDSSTPRASGPPPPLPAGKATEMTFRAFPSVYEDKQAAEEGKEPVARPTITCQEPDAIGELVSVLQTGRQQEDHKCRDLGEITLAFPSGEIALGFLPGHCPDYYEVRFERKNYQLDRKMFLEALRHCGIATDQIPQEPD